MADAQLLLPADAWPSKTFPRPPVAHVLTQLAEFLKQIGYAKTVKALNKEAESKGITVGSQGLATQSGPLKLSLGDLYLDAFMNWPEELEDETKSDTSESSSDEDIEDEMTATPPKPSAKATKRKRDESESESESDSDSESSSDEDSSSDESAAPVAKKAKIKEANSDSESSSSDEASDSSDESSSEDEASAEEDTTSADTSNSSSEDSSDESSDSSSDSDDSSSDDSSSDDASTPKPKIKTEKKKKTVDTSSDSSNSSVTLAGSGTENNGGMHPARASRMAPPAPVKNDRLSEGGKKRVEPFSRIPKDQKVDTRFGSNAYVSYDYADRAHNDLIVTKGKGFTKEKNKKKRGSYRGGMIDTTPKGIQFDD